MTARRHRSKFWTVYAIVAAVLALLIATALVVFYDFIDAFEEAQPQSAAEAATKYAKAMTSEEFRAMLETASKDITWHSEAAREKFISERADCLDDDKMFCRRAGGDEAHPIYSLISRGHELCRLELESVPTGRYSFKQWELCRAVAVFDSIEQYRISVPRGSIVTLDGEVLDESLAESCECPHDTAVFDSGAPSFVTYTTEPFDTAPSICAVYNGEQLVLEANGSIFTSELPSQLLYSAALRVPHGAVVTVRGFGIAESAQATTEDAFKASVIDGVRVPQYDVYTLDGLCAPLENVVVSLDGRELEYSSVLDGHAMHIDCLMSVADPDALYSFAEKFARAYFRYTSDGYRDIDENLAAVLTYVQPSSELYAKIRDSKIGYDFVTPVTSRVYNRLEATESYLLDDASYAVVFAFDIDHTIYSEKRSYSGELLLHIGRSGDGFTVLNMTIENA